MKANEFVKKFGLEAAKQNIDFLEHRSRNKSESKMAMLDDLKSLVESYELVELLGGLKSAKDAVIFTRQGGICRIEQAIRDVESCQ